MKVVDEKSLYLRLKGDEDEPESMYRLLVGVLGSDPVDRSPIPS